MRDYTWLDMMKIMQEIRLFSTLHVRRAKKEGITSAQEIDLLSRFDCPDGTLQIRSQPSDRPSGKERIS